MQRGGLVRAAPPDTVLKTGLTHPNLDKEVGHTGDLLELMNQPTLTSAALVAARALLGWSQADLAKHAAIPIGEVADFELDWRDVRPASIEAMAGAVADAGIALGDGGPRLAQDPGGATVFRGGQPVRWIEASDLVGWAERRRGQDGMPELLSRLIRAERGAAASVRFPSGDSVAQPGWDGVVYVDGSSPRIPDGQSGWETGADQQPKKKADGDFEARGDDPGELDPAITTFVFVTPRRWAKRKDAWAKEQRAKGIWKDVRAYDADDLVDWIECHPGVGQWLAARIGKRPRDLQSIAEIWEDWSGATQVPLSGELTRIGRDQDAASVLQWLSKRATEPVFVQAESVEEAAAFLYATIEMLPDPYFSALETRALAPETAAAAAELAGGLTPLILILHEADVGFAQRLARQGHHIYVALGPNSDAPNSVRRLAKPTRSQLHQVLVRMGLEYGHAENLSLDAGRSLAVLRRLMPPAPGRRPTWSVPPPSRPTLGALLAGGWLETLDGDKSVVEQLTGLPYQDAVRALGPYVTALDAPLRKREDVWRLKSPRDAWTLLAHGLTTADIDRFLAAYRDVCAEIDPTWDMAPDERWLAPVRDIRPRHSPLLKQSMTETMMLLALYGDRAALVDGIERQVAAALSEILDTASGPIWWSLGRVLPKVAEVAPSTFLNSIDRALSLTPSPLLAFFEPETSVHSHTQLPQLMWALEQLAWDPTLLPRVADILARLDELDGGGKNTARPKQVLTTIFLSWSPQTHATLRQRLAVIDALRKRHGDMAWDLMISLLPRPYSISMRGSSPQWREAAANEVEASPETVVKDCVVEVSARLVEDVGTLPKRWKALLKAMEFLLPEARTAIGARLLEAEPAIVAEEDRDFIRTALRKVLARHLEFQDADWTIPAAELEMFQTALKRFEPEDVLWRHAWLFSNGTGWMSSVRDWDRSAKEAAEARAKAFEEIVEECGIEGVLALIEKCDQPRWVGEAAARSTAAAPWRLDFIQRGLAADDGALWQAASEMIGLLRADEGGADLVTRLLPPPGSALDERAVGRLLHYLPARSETWAAIAAYGPAHEDRYWRTLGSWNLSDDKTEIEHAIRRFNAVGRARDALHLIGGRLKVDLDPDLIVETLHLSLKTNDAEDTESNEPVMRLHHLTRILAHLEAHPDVSNDAVVLLEWYYFHMLQYSERPSPLLHRELARNPDFFIQVLTMVYARGDTDDDAGEEDEDVPGGAVTPEQRVSMANHGYRVLEAWNRVPGADDRGRIDGPELERWVTVVRGRATKLGRLMPADHRIGRILGMSAKPPGEVWPPEPIRKILETAGSQSLEDAFVAGAHASRGVITRDLREGGRKERTLSDRYREHARAMAADSPVTARLLNGIADIYDDRAKREDDDVEERSWH